MLSEKKKRKRKTWSKKWYLKRNISCDAHLLDVLLETDVPWDDAIVVSADKLRKLWDSLSEVRSSLCERRLEKTVLSPALLPLKTAQFTQFFPSGMTSHIKTAQFNWECIAPFTDAFGTTARYKNYANHVAAEASLRPHWKQQQTSAIIWSRRNMDMKSEKTVRPWEEPAGKGRTVCAPESTGSVMSVVVTFSTSDGS
jgi:hypothetical protein